MKNNTLLQTLRKQMSNQIHYDYRPHVSPMTTEGMKSMSPSKQMTRNQINTNTIKPKRKATGIASLGPATRLEKCVGDCISSLCISPSYIDRLLNSSFFTRPIYNKCILPSYTGNGNIFTFGSAGKVSGQFINYMNGIVYAVSSIRKCSNPANPSQNTHIKNQKSARGKQIDTKVIKPIPNETTESCGQKTRHLQSDDIKSILNNWITVIYQPTHFLTIRLPENWSNTDEFKSNSHLRIIMKIFERSLLGKHWNKHHLPFVAFAENGTSDDWHYHILLNQGKFEEQELQNAILKTNIKLGLPGYCLKLDLIEKHLDEVEKYCTKEMKVYFDDRFDSDRIILSHDLFYLPYNNH